MERILSNQRKLTLGILNVIYRIRIRISEQKHSAYWYTFGVYQATRFSDIAHEEVKQVEVEPRKLTGIAQWWRKEEMPRSKRFEKWPHAPKVLSYERVHEYSVDAPWCTYVLLHPHTVPASSLTASEDQDKLPHRYVTNKVLFKGCVVDQDTDEKRKALENTTEKAFSLIDDVVPHNLLVELCGQLEKDVMTSSRSKLYEKVEDIIDNSKDKKLVVCKVVDQCISEQNSVLIDWLQKMRNIKKMTVNKEIQKNDWFIEYLQENLRSHGFTTSFEFNVNKFCIFGKSRPDFSFYKEKGEWIKVGLVTQPSDEMYGVQIDGASIQFKLSMGSDKDSNLLQALADMVRVANNLTVDALKVGKVVDSALVYGMLVSYDKRSCIPLKYYIDFQTNTSSIEVGEPGSFSCIFSFIVLVALA